MLGQGELICFGRISGFPRHPSSPQQLQNLRADYPNPHYAMAGGSHPSHGRRSPRDGEYQDVRQYPWTYRTENANSTVHHGEMPVRYSDMYLNFCLSRHILVQVKGLWPKDS